MNEQQIVEEVNRYLVDKSYQYAILIEGEWGCGKTYFVKNRLTQEINNLEKNRGKRKIKYISLYGCKSIDEIKKLWHGHLRKRLQSFLKIKEKLAKKRLRAYCLHLKVLLVE
ncbi:MAG: P-loop NTPase fold protein [Anaerobutyricum sp.]